MPTRIVPKTELRTRIKDELSRLGSNDAVVVTSRGRPQAVILSIQRWNELQQLIETLEGQLAEFEYGTADVSPGSGDNVYA